MSTGYVKFLVEHPHLRAILTLKDEEFDNVYHKLRGAQQPHPAHRPLLPGRQIPPEVRRRKVYVVRALILGAAIQFEKRRVDLRGGGPQMVHDCIQQALELA